MPPRIDDGKRAAILDDITAGKKSRAQIGRDHGVSPQTVKNIADEHGIEQPFSREQTVHATRARLADVRDLRSRLAERTLKRAHKVLDRLDANSFQSKHVAPNGKVVTVETEHPPARDERDLAAAVSSYTTAAERVTDHEDGADATKSLLAGLGDALQAAAAKLPDGTDGPGSGNAPAEP